MPSTAITEAASARLQENLRQGLNCIKDLWAYGAKSLVMGVHAADINQDGDIEVLAGSLDGRVCILSRDGHARYDKVIGGKKPVTAIVACPSQSNSLPA